MQRLLLLLLSGACSAQLVRDWHRVRTPHFELYSRYDPAQTAPLLVELEWVRAVFEANFGLKSGLDRPALLLVPDAPFDYEQFSPSKFANGHYVPAPWRDMIALREWFNARHSLLHEYTHLVLHHEGGRWPAWFNEGSAEFYATVRRDRQGVEAGLPEEGRTRVLRQGAWLPISYLIGLDHAAKLPTADANQRFYAQSWVAVHMLHLAPGYSQRFPEFRRLIAQGAAAEEALGRVYSKTLVQFDEDMREWFRRGRYPSLRLQAPEHNEVKAEVRLAGQVELDIACATLASASERGQPAAEYKKLTRAAGEDCGLQAPLGDLAFAARLWAEATGHYQRAMRCGLTARELVRGLESALSYRGEVAPEELEAAVAVGGGARSRYLLGVHRFFAGDMQAALREFDLARGLPPAEEFRMTRLRAVALSRLGRFAEAEAAAARLPALASTADEHRSAELTVGDVRRDRQYAEHPPESPEQALLRSLTRLEGEVTRVDCLGNRARFWIRSGTQTIRLLVADPGEVFAGAAGRPPLEFACGPQSRRVTVGYQPGDGDGDTAGRIRYLEFR